MTFYILASHSSLHHDSRPTWVRVVLIWSKPLGLKFGGSFRHPHHRGGKWILTEPSRDGAFWDHFDSRTQTQQQNAWLLKMNNRQIPCTVGAVISSMKNLFETAKMSARGWDFWLVSCACLAACQSHNRNTKHRYAIPSQKHTIPYFWFVSCACLAACRSHLLSRRKKILGSAWESWPKGWSHVSLTCSSLF